MVVQKGIRGSFEVGVAAELPAHRITGPRRGEPAHIYKDATTIGLRLGARRFKQTGLLSLCQDSSLALRVFLTQCAAGAGIRDMVDCVQVVAVAVQRLGERAMRWVRACTWKAAGIGSNDRNLLDLAQVERQQARIPQQPAGWSKRGGARCISVCEEAKATGITQRPPRQPLWPVPD
jgi:hypothetical protein